MDGVYVSFSGGKDSTVLLHIARRLYPDIKGLFINTGLEFPEIVKFVKGFDEIRILKPKIPFHKVIEHYGYPVISKEVACNIRKIRNTNLDSVVNRILNGREKDGAFALSAKWIPLAMKSPFKISEYCCNKLKKEPYKRYERITERKPIIGMMMEESKLRANVLSHSCNRYDSKRPTSNPLREWSDELVWKYIKKYKVPYSPIYDMGYKRTGCMFCMFGAHLEKEGEHRFLKLEKTHPVQYKYCMEKIGLKEVLGFLNIPWKEKT